MPRRVSIGSQNFADIRDKDYFIVDKTDFIRQWWLSGDVVTLICRPRRFGKTLTLDMVNCFFSRQWANRADLFEGMKVWDDIALQSEQGSWPVISLSFSEVKASTYKDMYKKITGLLADLYQKFWPELENNCTQTEMDYIQKMATEHGNEADVAFSVRRLCTMLWRLTGKNTIVLLDEYDTPLQEAWISGYWDEASEFFRGFFNSTLKANTHLERGLVTGITRVARESIFSDLNNLEVVTTSSNKYETCFGFTQAEVDSAMEEFGLDDREGVRKWYDGFTFGSVSDIYNPWSITNYLDKRKLDPYWANTSGNSLISSLVAHSDAQLKSDFETLLSGGTVKETISELVAFIDLDYDPAAIWSLMAASGYLRVLFFDSLTGNCELAITNYETRLAFDGMVRRWFSRSRVAYNGFVRALLSADIDAMNAYMNDVALDTFSVFDSGAQPSRNAPERFYHGFVLGLLVDLRGRYLVRSNRESGYGRYDVMLVPTDTQADDGIIIEFKVFDLRHEETLEQTAARALEQIEEKGYAAELLAQGLPQDRIHTYGFAFKGKQVLIER